MARMKRVYIILAGIVLVSAALGIFLGPAWHRHFFPVSKVPTAEPPAELHAPSFAVRPAKIAPLSYREYRALRTHLNEEHIQMAERLGFRRVKDERAFHELLEAGRLVPLEGGTKYVLGPLDDSVPYLAPMAARLLDETATRFQDEIRKLGLPPRLPWVSSALRTTGSQRHLRRWNRNAAPVSAHEFGLAFDIGYRRFFPPGSPPPAASSGPPLAGDPCEDPVLNRKLKAVLARVLIRLQDEGRCLVIIENNQSTLHVTAAR